MTNGIPGCQSPGKSSNLGKKFMQKTTIFSMVYSGSLELEFKPDSSDLRYMHEKIVPGVQI